jgi:hypothetical protein
MTANGSRNILFNISFNGFKDDFDFIELSTDLDFEFKYIIQFQFL